MSVSKIEQLIEDIFDFVENSKSSFTNPNKVTLHRDELYDMLDELRIRTPEEIKKYQKIIANKDRILDDAKHNANIMLEEANTRATTLVNESEMVHQANERAEAIVQSAIEDAKRIIAEANSDAHQIRTGAIGYTNDLLTHAEGIIQGAFVNTKSKYDMVFEALQADLELIETNKRELEQDLPREMRPELEEEIVSEEELNELLEEVSE